MIDISDLLQSDCPFRVLCILMQGDDNHESVSKSLSTVPTNVPYATSNEWDSVGTGDRGC